MAFAACLVLSVNRVFLVNLAPLANPVQSVLKVSRELRDSPVQRVTRVTSVSLVSLVNAVPVARRVNVVLSVILVLKEGRVTLVPGVSTVPLVHPVLPVSQSLLCQTPLSRLAVSDVVPVLVPRIAISATSTTTSNSAPLTWVWIPVTWNIPTVLSLAKFSLL